MSYMLAATKASRGVMGDGGRTREVGRTTDSHIPYHVPIRRTVTT